MRLACPVFSTLVFASTLITAALAAPPGGSADPGSPWTVTWEPQVRPMALQPGLKPLMGPVLHLLEPNQAAEAIVEVWGDTTQEPIKLFQARLNPELVAAYEKGHGFDTSAQMLAESSPALGDVHAPTSPAVYYNCLQPTRYDPALLAHTARGGLWLTASVGPSRR